MISVVLRDGVSKETTDFKTVVGAVDIGFDVRVEIGATVVLGGQRADLSIEDTSFGEINMGVG